MTPPTAADSGRSRLRVAVTVTCSAGFAGEQGHLHADFLIQVKDQILDVGAITGCVNLQAVGSGIEQGDQEIALRTGDGRALLVGFPFDERHRGARDRLFGGVGDLSADGAAGGLRV